MSELFVIEWIATLLSLIFLVLLIQEKKWCWLFGIISSVLSAYLFFRLKLYSEAILYGFYTFFGGSGWYKWDQSNAQEPLQIKIWNIFTHLKIVGLGVVLAIGVGYLFKFYTDADKSFIDAHTSIFGLIATYLEANKVLRAWFYWIAINGVTIWLYFIKGLTVYTGLMVIYFILSFVGLYQWQKRFVAQKKVR